MNFIAYTSAGKTYTIEQQQDAWDRYIEQDKYLKKHRGEYAERNGVIFPLVSRMDLSLNQEFNTTILGKRNGFILRFDIFNFTNLLNNKWGVAQTLQNNMPLIALSPGADGKPAYMLRAINTELVSKSFINTATLNDVFRMQLTIKWMFNQSAD